MVDTVSDVIDDNGSLLTEAPEAARCKRHEELTLTNPNETDYQKLAHQINRKIRDAVETTIFDGVLDREDIPAETALFPKRSKRFAPRLTMQPSRSWR